MSDIAAELPCSILMFISSLQGGGAERVMSELANELTRRGHPVCIVTYLADASTDFYPLDPQIERIAIDAGPPAPTSPGRLWRILRIVRALRGLLRERKPGVALAFMESANVMLVLAALGMRLRTAVCERTDPSMNLAVPAVWRLGRNLLYRRADAVIAQTQAAAQWLCEHCRVKVTVLPNGLRPLPQPSSVREDIVLSVGRLSEEKGHDILLRAYALVRMDFPSWRLILAGDGPQRETLEALAAELGLSEVAQFIGRTPQIESWYGRASIVAQPSRFEGFPNAVLEAMGMGAAVISTDCRSGPSELIKSEENGILVPVDNVAELAGALRRLMSDPHRRAMLGNAALGARQAFAAGPIYDQWARLLNAHSCDAQH